MIVNISHTSIYQDTSLWCYSEIKKKNEQEEINLQK